MDHLAIQVLTPEKAPRADQDKDQKERLNDEKVSATNTSAATTSLSASTAQRPSLMVARLGLRDGSVLIVCDANEYNTFVARRMDGTGENDSARQKKGRKVVRSRLGKRDAKFGSTKGTKVLMKEMEDWMDGDLEA